MRNYIILNGVNSNTITGLLISKLPPITKPKIRTQTEEIDGRDGDIVTKLGYSAYDKEIEIGLYGNFDINEVIAYFNTEGTIVFSNEADKYYNYQILDQIDYEKLIRFKTAKVKMHVQPFKYPLEETPVEINIQNVTGSGETISLDNTAEAPVTLALKGNTSQDGTPTPDAPVEVNTVTGRQEINVIGKNLFNKDTATTQVGYFNTNGGIVSGGESTVTTSYIPILPNTNMTISGFIVNRICYYDKNKTFLERSEVITGYPYTFNKNAYYIRIQGGTAVFDINKFQLEAGNTATTYEAYQGQSYELDLGKNLFNIDGTVQVGTLDKYNNGFKLIKGTNRVINFKLPQTCGAGTYTVSYEVVNTTLTAVNKFGFQALNNNSSVSNNVDNDNHKITFTTASEFNALYFYIMSDQADTGTITLDNVQLEKGDTASSFAPYKTPIELCYMPNTEYRDYFFKDNNKWYIKRQIGKYVYNNDLTNNSITADKVEMLTPALDIVANTRPLTNIAICNMMGSALSNYTGLDGTTSAKKIRVNMSTSYASSYNEFNTLASNNNFTIYYILGTPEDEEITDNTLIGQLNALENARSYDTTTHINQNTANKPFIINATAVQKGSDTGTVDNIGNIYAKPTIDIEGSGIVEIYLDGNQIFNVDLSTINECVIDTTNLEAYNPATTQLMNRQVTGDYSNFKINVGDNQVKVSGAVTKATISNYTRWL